MAASVWDANRRRMPDAAVAAHAPRGACSIFWTSSAGAFSATYCSAWPHPCEPRIHSRRQLCCRLDGVRNTLYAVPLGRPPIAFCFLWRPGVSNHVGADRADDLYGYLLPRFQVLCRSTSVAIAVVAFAWSLPHVFLFRYPFTPLFCSFGCLRPG